MYVEWLSHISYIMQKHDHNALPPSDGDIFYQDVIFLSGCWYEAGLLEHQSRHLGVRGSKGLRIPIDHR